MDRLVIREYREEIERLHSEIEELQRRNAALESVVRKAVLETVEPSERGEA